MNYLLVKGGVEVVRRSYPHTVPVVGFYPLPEITEIDKVGSNFPHYAAPSRTKYFLFLKSHEGFRQIWVTNSVKR